MIFRETAWRVFASEFNSSSLEIKGEGDRAPSYVITPLGAKINRIMAVGILTDKQNVGTESEPIWRAQLSDGTDRFYLYAGKYAPEALHAISSLPTPCIAAVVGKCRTYSPQEGNLYVSLRPERIIETTPELRDYWIIETAKATLKRIELTEEALEIDTPKKQDLLSHGFPELLAEGISSAISHYGKVDTNRYRGMLLEVLGQVASEGGILMPESNGDFDIPDEFDFDEDKIPQEVFSVPQEVSQDIPQSMPADQMDEDQKEEFILKLIDSLDSNRKGAPLTELTKEAVKSGIGESELEEITTSLLDKGLVYEPTIGKMKRI